MDKAAAKQEVNWGLLGAGDIARKRVAPAIAAVSGSIPVSI